MSSPAHQGGILYIVATPIGNLSDMTARAIETLRQVELIAAEDTRHSARLLQHFGINTKMIAYHDFSDESRLNALLEALGSGSSIALISDAGTPLISDPGYRLVNRARDQGVNVVPIPGVSALTTALCVAGLPTDRFAFEGFPAAKSSARLQQFQALAQESRTLVFYESPHRIVDSLKDMLVAFGELRKVAICRELTKTFETIHSDTLANLLVWIAEDENRQRGEFVVVVAGLAKPVSEELDAEAVRILKILLEEFSVKQASALAARITGAKKNSLYQLALSLGK